MDRVVTADCCFDGSTVPSLLHATLAVAALLWQWAHDCTAAPRKLTAVIFLAWVFRIALLPYLQPVAALGHRRILIRSGDAAAYHRLAQSVLAWTHGLFGVISPAIHT